MTNTISVYGVPIPLQYITPNLRFYPLVIPSNITYISNQKNKHINYINLNIPPIYYDKYHTYFIWLLMTSLNRKYIIIGNFLIDLTRKDYLITINFENKQISINDYKPPKCFKYLNENIFKKHVKFPQLPSIDNNFDINFLREHCNRICEGTKLVKNYVSLK